ncbi:MAG TPA: hypothetical protein VMW52_09610 [Phycisphaerae bacterium]|nr:hypothetical protein [Phycisphaerae bacterium]
MTEELKLLVVPLVAALMMMVKLVPPLQPETRRWILPWIATALGVLGAWLVSESFTRLAVLQGLVWGLSAAGLYDVGLKPIVAAVVKAKNGTNGLLLFLCVGLALAAGCSVHPATIRVLEFERECLDTEEIEVYARYQADLAVVEANIENIWQAAYTDIEAHQPPDPAWTLDTIKGTRAAIELLEARKATLVETRLMALDNLAARKELLSRGAALVEKSQQWPADAKAWAAELRELLEKK